MLIAIRIGTVATVVKSVGPTLGNSGVCSSSQTKVVTVTIDLEIFMT